MYRHEFQKLAVVLLVNAKEVFLPNILMVKKHQIRLKQTWVAEIKFNVLNPSNLKDSDKDMYSFSY